MSLINVKPDQTSFDKEVALLNAAGLKVPEKGGIEDRFMHEMQNGGLSPEEVVGTIAQIMQGGENSHVKLSAAKMALSMYMHPAFVPRKEAERKEQPVINIQINNGQVDMVGILTPNTFEE